MRLSYILGGLVIIAALAFGASAFGKSLTPYVPFAEAHSGRGPVQVHGYIDGKGSYDAENDFHFTLVDDRGDRMEIVYKGLKPANFDQATGVVAVGQYQNGVFQAKQLLVKCPSKYQEQGPAGGQGK